MATKSPVEIPQGAIRFNTDSQKMEFYAQDQWWEMATDVPTLDGGARGIWAGGADPSYSNMIQAFNIATTGSCFDFGNLSSPRYYAMGCSSRTRAVWGGGSEPSGYVDTIEYVTILSKGDYTAFGELVGTDRHNAGGGCANQIRGVYLGGEHPSKTAEIDYITIASTGNSEDFGDLSAARATITSFASPTRGVAMGGSESPGAVTTIEYVTIPTTGSISDFGEQYVQVYGGGGGGNSTRGIQMGGYTSPDNTNVIQYVTIASTGNSMDFGDITDARRYGATCSSPTRAVYCGGANPSLVNTLDFIQIATQGNAVEFGDQVDHIYAQNNGCSNAHGGL